MPQVLVQELMTSHVLRLGPHDDVERARVLMAELGVRHVPVVDEYGKLVGVVTARDLLRQTGAGGKSTGGVHVGDVMTPDARWVPPGEGIPQAARIMIEDELSCLPVVKAGQLVGILTEKDFVRYLARTC